jgi:shikimate dehydrogenase
MIILPEPAKQPTLYFIGVTTAQSLIMRIFPAWADELGLEGACIKGIDMALHAPAEDYRQVVSFIKVDPLSMGALVTTHKIDLYHAAKDLFDYLDPYAQLFGELSSISKQDGQLRGHAKDPISSGLAMDAFIPPDHWRKTGAEVVVLGAGGSALAISAYLSLDKFGGNVPSRIHLTNRSEPRLAEAMHILSASSVPMSYHLCPTPDWNDKIVSMASPGSLIINATGLGKDRPGSPLTDNLLFPMDGLVWELNYRGSLKFLRQAQKQQLQRNLLIEDGWTYFIHGWTQVIAEVFHIEISGECFAACSRLAAKIHGRQADKVLTKQMEAPI